MTMTTNIDANAITDIMLRPAHSWRHDLAEVASLILGVENDNREYWADELENGRLYIEVNPYDGDEWNVALSVYVASDFIGDILLRGDYLEVF